MYANPELVRYPHETSKQLKRFGAMIGGGGLAIAAAVAADGWLGKRHWPQTENQFSDIAPNANEVSVSFGGLGVTCSEELAQDARKFLTGASVHTTYSNSNFSIEHLARAFSKKATGVELLNINGHSWGGPVGLETGRLANMPNMKLGRIVLNCSPFDNDDVHLGRYTKLFEMMCWPVGPGSKLLFSFSRSRLEGKPFREAWQQAKYDAVNGCDPSLYLTQVPTMRAIKLAREQYKPLIGPKTQVIYCRPEDASADMVVKTPQASERFSEFFGALGVPFQDVPIPNVGHAQSGPTYDFLAKRAA